MSWYMATTIVKDLYDALLAAGVEEETASRAAAAVISRDNEVLATKDDLRRAEIRIISWVVGAITIAVFVERLLG